MPAIQTRQARHTSFHFQRTTHLLLNGLLHILHSLLNRLLYVLNLPIIQGDVITSSNLGKLCDKRERFSNYHLGRGLLHVLNPLLDYDTLRRYVEGNPMSSTVVEDARRSWVIPLRTLFYIVLNYGFKSE